MSIEITEHIKKGEELIERILPEIENIPARLDPRAERSPQATIILSKATKDLTKWLNVSLKIIKEDRPEDFKLCEERSARIIDSVDAEKYNLLFSTDSVCATVSNNLHYILGILESIDDDDDIAETDGNKIFIVHGNDHTLRDQVKEYIESLGFKAVVLLNEQDGGRFVLEKFMDYAAECGHAIILMTADDQCISSDSVKMRARQNVIFEYGFFVGRLGNKNVRIIRDSNVESPSDIDGMTRINSKNWKDRLKKEIEHWS